MIQAKCSNCGKMTYVLAPVRVKQWPKTVLGNTAEGRPRYYCPQCYASLQHWLKEADMKVLSYILMDADPERRVRAIWQGGKNE